MGGQGLPQDPASEASPPGSPHPLCAAPGLLPPATGRNTLTLEVLDDVLDAELCEQGHGGQ